MSTVERAITAFKAMRLPLEEELAGLRAGTRLRSELRNGERVDTTGKVIELYESWLAFVSAEIASLEDSQS